MKQFKNIFKAIIILCILEVVVLSFVILYGLEFGFELWNWITIIIAVSIYIIFTISIIVWENKGKNKVDKNELIVDNFYKEQAQLILNAIDDYLEKNKKVYNDLKLYWPFYKAILKRIAIGKKFNRKDYEITEQLQNWQKENYEDAFLMNIYDVLINNIV